MPTPTDSQLSTIIPFNLIVDTDFGLIRLIKEFYYNKNTFNGLVEAPTRVLIYFLYTRKEVNPLYTIFKDKEDTEAAEAYYKEFMEKEYTRILNRSITTELFNAVKLFTQSDGAIKTTILCKNESEKKFIEMSELNGLVDTIVGTYEDCNLEEHDPIYFKDFRDTLPILKQLKGKNLYIANYKFNFDKLEGEDVLLPEISLLLLDKNDAKITDIYRIKPEDIPVG